MTSIRKFCGFTLAEVLIALLILAEISTFTIPKIITSQQNGRYNAIAKEAMGTVADAFTRYSYQYTLSANTTGKDLTQYMNYVSIDTSTVADGAPSMGNPTHDCANSGLSCLRQANGSLLVFKGGSCPFNGTTANRFLWVLLDPDGKGTTTRDSLWILLYYNGKITTGATMAPGSFDCNSAQSAASSDPTWFSF